MSFESTAEGRVGVDGADRWRKTVPHVGTTDRESPSSELGPVCCICKYNGFIKVCTSSG